MGEIGRTARPDLAAQTNIGRFREAAGPGQDLTFQTSEKPEDLCDQVISRDHVQDLVHNLMSNLVPLALWF